jgi:hypothetical protein
VEGSELGCSWEAGLVRKGGGGGGVLSGFLPKQGKRKRQGPTQRVGEEEKRGGQDDAVHEAQWGHCYMQQSGA